MGLISTCVPLLIVFLWWLSVMKWLVDTSPLPLAVKLFLITLTVILVSFLFWISADRTRIRKVKFFLVFVLELIFSFVIYRLFYWGTGKIIGYISLLLKPN
ncbi:unnamed protein product [Caenorhabditis brenneri]